MTPLSLLIVAVVAVAAGTLAGVVGFGSAVILLPLCSYAFGAREAVPILTVAALLGNLSRAWVSRREVDWPAVGLYLLGGVPGAIFGALSFVRIEARGLPILFGLFVIASVPGRRWANRADLRVRQWHLPIIGAVMGLISALVSSAGPINAPLFLSYGLVGGAYLATEALGAAGIHMTKALIYGRFAVAQPEQLAVGVLVGACLMIGSYLGKRVVERLDRARFVAVVEALLLLSGLILIGQGGWLLVRG